MRRDAVANTDEITIDHTTLRDPVEVLADGRCVYDVECRARFVLPLKPAARNKASNVPEVDTRDRAGEAEARQIGDSVEGEIIEGVASSTSVDWYGTRMSREALDMMASQFVGGVVYIPRHGSMFESVEWDQVIGRTFEADVERASVAEPRDEGEEQFVLRVRIRLFDEPLSRSLVRRIDRGEKIGQSIGGWFTKLRVVTDEEGEVSDIIVMGVELDHLAVTRSPANPDSDRLRISMRSMLAEAFAARGTEDRPGGYATEDARAEKGGKAIRSPEIEFVDEGGDGGGDEGEGDSTDHDTRQPIEPLCSLSIEERDGYLSITFDREASTADIRAAAEQILKGEHGEAVARAVGVVVRDLEPADDDSNVELTEEPEAEEPVEAPESTTTEAPEEGAETASEAPAEDEPGEGQPPEPDQPAGDPGTEEEETEMDEAALLAAIQSAVAVGIAEGMRTVHASASPGGAPPETTTEEPAPAPAPAPAERSTEDSVDVARIQRQLQAMRDRAERAEQRVADLAARPARMGEHNRTVDAAVRGGYRATGAWESMVNRSREEGFVSLPAVVERATEVLSASDIATRGVDLGSLLRDGLNAAEDDGLLVEPSIHTSWGG